RSTGAAGRARRAPGRGASIGALVLLFSSRTWSSGSRRRQARQVVRQEPQRRQAVHELAAPARQHLAQKHVNSVVKSLALDTSDASSRLGSMFLSAEAVNM